MINPKIPQTTHNFVLKKCTRCGGSFGPENFSYSKSFFFPDGVLPICNSCLKDFLTSQSYSWDAVDKVCQLADIPFVPREWEKIYDANGDDAFPVYAAMFRKDEYEGLGWKEYYDAFKELKEQKTIEEEIPLLREEKFRKLRERCGENYDDEALVYLEDLYNGILMTQNVNGALQTKQAQQLCMISYELEQRIRNGEEFDKLLASYDKLVKVAEFTPKNAKNASDFDSTGELWRWLEKRGWKNKFYDNVTRDIVDETIKNIQAYNQRLYTNESGIGDEISRRIDALKHAAEQESYYDLTQTESLDEFENAGFEELFSDADFEVDLDDDDE